MERQVAIVTGASRGLGRAIASELAGRNMHVVINYNSNEKEALKTLVQVEAAGGSGEVMRADVADAGAVQRMIADIQRRHGRIDLLVNNAGIVRDELFLSMREQSWRQVLGVNLDGVYNCCRAVIRGMCAASRGVIINIGSSSSVAPRAGQVNYGASKSSLIGFSKSLAREVAPRGVRVLVVAPGFVETDMSNAVPQHVIEETLRMIPLGRWARPEEIAELIGFIAFDAGGYITGQTLVIDGGRMAVENDFRA
jgi:3-oxoacyl-[acyl-carrier protein] reductase